MSKKTLEPHLDYIEECLGILKIKIEEAKEYLKDTPWKEVPAVDDREKEFKFQATLIDRYVSWQNEYAKLSGIIESFKDLNQVDDKEVRKGSSRSAFAEMIKEGKFDE